MVNVLVNGLLSNSYRLWSLIFCYIDVEVFKLLIDRPRPCIMSNNPDNKRVVDSAKGELSLDS
jgi:hypothetical protein